MATIISAGTVIGAGSVIKVNSVDNTPEQSPEYSSIDFLDETTGWNFRVGSNAVADYNGDSITFISDGGSNRFATKEISGLIVGETYTISGVGNLLEGTTTPEAGLIVGVGTVDTYAQNKTSLGEIQATFDAQYTFDQPDSQGITSQPDVTFVATASIYYVTLALTHGGISGALDMEDISVTGPSA